MKSQGEPNVGFTGQMPYGLIKNSSIGNEIVIAREEISSPASVEESCTNHDPIKPLGAKSVEFIGLSGHSFLYTRNKPPKMK